MPHAFFFGLKIVGVIIPGGNDNGDTFNDLKSVAGNTDQFAGVVGEQPDTFYALIQQDLYADPILPQISGKSEFLIGFDGIASLILKFVGMDLIENADTPALLAQIDKDSGAGFCDLPHGGMELIAAIAAA